MRDPAFGEVPLHAKVLSIEQILHPNVLGDVNAAPRIVQFAQQINTIHGRVNRIRQRFLIIATGFLGVIRR